MVLPVPAGASDPPPGRDGQIPRDSREKGMKQPNQGVEMRWRSEDLKAP